MRLVAGALEELFESVAKRGKALRAANPTTFQMDLTVAVANEVGLGARVQGSGCAASATPDHTLASHEPPPVRCTPCLLLQGPVHTLHPLTNHSLQAAG